MRVRPGQVWRDLDPRRNELIEVARVVRHTNGIRYVVGFRGVQYRKTIIRLDRMRRENRSKGYSLIPDVEL